MTRATEATAAEATAAAVDTVAKILNMPDDVDIDVDALLDDRGSFFSLEPEMDAAMNDLFQQDRETSTKEDSSSCRSVTPPPPSLQDPSQHNTSDATADSEATLAKKMQQLYMEEGDRVVFDVHGLPQIVDQDPDDLQPYLSRLEQNINEMPADKKQAFLKARDMNPAYINSEQLRLMFLRAKRFDTQEAAENIVYHFEVKQVLWGDGECLGRQIHYSDLSEDDRSSADSGFMSVLPERDAAGRAVMWFRPVPEAHKTAENCMRAMWYIGNNILSSTETQKKGIVVVFYNVGAERTSGFEMIRKIQFGRDAMPRKLVGAHLCHNSSWLKPLTECAKFYLAKSDSIFARFRPHKGNHDAVVFDLQTYGIPISRENVRDGGGLPPEWHASWLAGCRKNEERTMVAKTTTGQEEAALPQEVILPSKLDVLFGRGKSTREHHGNMRCLQLVEERLPEYESSSKYAKTNMAERVVSDIIASGGRFLKRDRKLGWQIVDSDSARDKVSHYFRAVRAKGGCGGSTDDASPSSSPEVEKRVLDRFDMEGEQPTNKQVRS
ncbi:MAG: hypothetical protein SGILL_003680 [Bacillariaceae sp.]